MKDLVTVFTPVYNRKNLIGNLYQSLLSQTYKNFEWIIVDDGSTDDIDEIIKSYQNEDRILIRFIKQENGGKHRAINNGVLHAKGELFYIVDSDLAAECFLNFSANSLSSTKNISNSLCKY